MRYIRLKSEGHDTRAASCSHQISLQTHFRAAVAPRLLSGEVPVPVTQTRRRHLSVSETTIVTQS